MAEKITKQEVQQFFSEYVNTHNSLELQSSGDWIFPFDILHYQTIPPDGLEPIFNLTFPKREPLPLVSQVFKVEYSALASESIIIALDKNGEILWLDNRDLNDDFSKFLINERLFDVLPSDPLIYAEMLLNTKFNYLRKMQPKIIDNVGSIPGFSKYIMLIPRKLRRILFPIERKITPPKIENLDGVVKITFTIWTRVLGLIINITCIWQDKIFTHIEKLVGADFGDMIIQI